MEKSQQEFVTFTVHDVKCGLSLDAVIQAVPSVYITPLPQPPSFVCGTINYRGSILPVFDLRKALHFQLQPLLLTQLLLICQTTRRKVALIVDEVTDVERYEPNDLKASTSIVPGLPVLSGVIKTKDGLLLIHDINAFLTLEEEKQLELQIDGKETK